MTTQRPRTIILLLCITISKICLNMSYCEGQEIDEDCIDYDLTIVDQSNDAMRTENSSESETEDTEEETEDHTAHKDGVMECSDNKHHISLDAMSSTIQKTSNTEELPAICSSPSQCNDFYYKRFAPYDIASYILDTYESCMAQHKTKKYTRPVNGACVGDIMAIYIANNLPDNMDDTISRINKVGANAVIVNIKDDFGRITFDISESDNKTLACRSMIKNMKQKIVELKKQGFYTIARIVTYKDTSLITKQEHYKLYILNKKIPQDEVPQKTDIWCDKEKVYWLNPFSKQVTQYLLSIVREACLIGFDEIHLDYVRFSNYLPKTIEAYNKSENKTRDQAITEFVQEAQDIVHSYGKKLSVAIFGIIPIEAYMYLTESVLCNYDDPLASSISKGDSNKYLATMSAIGQNYNSLAKIADYICPMLYPSHFPYGYFGVEMPDKNPYHILYTSIKMADFVSRYYCHKSEIRPYLQCFTASWLPKDSYMKYDGQVLDQQIKACCDNDIYSFYLFNGVGNYKDFYMCA